jgi:hypothetical protein
MAHNVCPNQHPDNNPNCGAYSCPDHHAYADTQHSAVTLPNVNADTSADYA